MEGKVGDFAEHFQEVGTIPVSHSIMRCHAATLCVSLACNLVQQARRPCHDGGEGRRLRGAFQVGGPVVSNHQGAATCQTPRSSIFSVKL